MKFGITYGKNLVDDKNFWFQMGRNGENARRTCHSTTVVLDRSIQELLDVRKSYDFVELRFHLGSTHPQDSSVQIDVLPACEIGMRKPVPDLQEDLLLVRMDPNPAGSRFRNPGKYF